MGPVPYDLLPPNLFSVQLAFHMSMLKIYHEDIDYIIKWDSIVLVKNLQYYEEPISILGRDVPMLSTNDIKFVKV